MIATLMVEINNRLPRKSLLDAKLKGQSTSARLKKPRWSTTGQSRHQAGRPILISCHWLLQIVACMSVMCSLNMFVAPACRM